MLQSLGYRLGHVEVSVEVSGLSFSLMGASLLEYAYMLLNLGCLDNVSKMCDP